MKKHAFLFNLALFLFVFTFSILISLLLIHVSLLLLKTPAINEILSEPFYLGFFGAVLI